EHPERDRPRERLWSVGPAALTGRELLAILLGTGCSGRDALAVAAEVLARVDGSLRSEERRVGKECRARWSRDLGKRTVQSAVCLCFFFQAEDGIRDKLVTGVQTCALPISSTRNATVPVSVCGASAPPP